ncbi:MAG: bacteriochlorophyll 4-vinyl reductase [Pseudomonadota bacterium]
MLIEGPLIAERQVAGPLSAPAAESDKDALIGPHAVIHLAQVMHEVLGRTATHTVLGHAQIETLPSGHAMIPEIEALRLHRWLLLWEPVEGFAIAREAARRTADYIIANRIPGPAAALLRLLPAALAAPLLMRAIRHHAWTFIGAGRFEPHSARDFTIDRSAVDDPMPVPDSTFDWYGAVFERLYQQLVASDCQIITQTMKSASPAARNFHLMRGNGQR